MVDGNGSDMLCQSYCKRHQTTVSICQDWNITRLLYLHRNQEQDGAELEPQKFVMRVCTYT